MEAIKKIEINKIVKIILIAIAGTLLLTISSKIKRRRNVSTIGFIVM